MTVVLTKRTLENVKTVYFAEDGKLDISFIDGKESITISPATVVQIND